MKTSRELGRIEFPVDGRRCVPEFLPQVCDEALPARHISFCKAILFHWIRPAYGPHLAADSFTRALVAYSLSACVLSVQVVAVLLLVNARDMAMEYGLRDRMAMLVYQAMSMTARSSLPDAQLAVVVLGAPIYLGIALIILGLLIAPNQTAGDRLAIAIKRSVNRVLWATVTLPWIGAIVIVVCAWYCYIEFLVPNNGGSRFVEACLYASTMLAVIVAVLVWRVLWRFGQSRPRVYIGPGQGPEFESRRPECEDCGYLIGGLPADAKCPECGLAVTCSMPRGRRSMLLPDSEELTFQDATEYLKIAKRLYSDPDAIVSIPLRDVGAARRFWLMLCLSWLLGTLAVLIPLWAVCDSYLGRSALGSFFALAILAVALMPLSLDLIALPACCIGRIAFGIRDARVCLAVIYYSSTNLWPIPILTALFIMFVYLPTINGWGVFALGGKIESQSVGLIVVVGLGICVLARFIRRVLIGLRTAAFANS